MAILNHYAKAQIDSNKISNNDKLVRSYIDRSIKERKDRENDSNFSFDEIIEDDNHWQVFYNLSDLRSGIINWYDFKPGAKVLEVGAAFGALTGTLLKKCADVHVTERSLFRGESIAERYPDARNLVIHIGDVSDEEFCDALPKDFDYILLVGILERIGNGSKDVTVYADYLKMLSEHLKYDGKFLIAVENRFGLKYFCGAPEPHTNRAFDGIDGYRRGTAGRSFARQEFCEILRLAGLNQYKMYYPLPDYKLPQLVYTDEYLPEKNLSERLIPYYVNNNTLVAKESLLYDDIISNGAFPFMANSFFVECAKLKEAEFCDVQYAAVSTDRGRERSYATTIHKDGIVCKRPLFAEGKRNAEQLYQNMLELSERGLPVVDHEISENGDISMPYVSWPTLSNYIKEVKRNKEVVLDILDRIYTNIIKASDVVEETEQGPILKKAYMELIPLNCFVNPKTKEFLYFDQEFVKEKYPAKYVLFRAIHYIYVFTPDMESCIPKEDIIARYDMQDLWPDFEKEEEKFLKDVRNKKRYSQFYCWAKVDDKKIFDNSGKLNSETEVIAEYEISDKMKKTWKVELEILDEIERICKKANLKYFLVHGSLLGAVRHKGFIPWDDDLDIAMPRKDYEAFLAIAKAEIKKPLVICEPGSESDLYWGGATRIKNVMTTAIEPRDLNHKGNLGIWVDILPYDICPENEALLEKKIKKVRKCHALMQAKVYGKEWKKEWNKEGFLKQWNCFAACFFSMEQLRIKLNKALHLFTDSVSENVAFFTGGNSVKLLNTKFFESTILMDFENRKIPAPVGYKEYLFATLGGDYMKFPPQEERKPKHKGIYDPGRPYTEYQNLLCNMFEDAKGKQIILWGSGFMFEDYMKKYGDKYRPAFLVDNDKNKWGRSRMGIEIKEPRELMKVPEEKRKLIICSYYYKEIAKQLEDMGIKEYKVYVQRLDWILKSENDGKEV